jgi:ribosomal protein L44E
VSKNKGGFVNKQANTVDKPHRLDGMSEIRMVNRQLKRSGNAVNASEKAVPLGREKITKRV